MLRGLSIRDFVIVERLELEFQRGFTALTGETGAGKSILIDALAVAMGERAESALIREGAEKAEVSAEFDLAQLPQLATWLTANEFECDEGVYLVRRVIDRGGRSRSFVNGSPATLAQVREAGAYLVDIHGQHEHQSLLRAATQRETLDAYGGLQDVAAETRAAYRVWRERVELRHTFEKDAAALRAERERLEWQTKDLEALAFTPEQWEALQGEHGRLTHAAALIDGTRQALDALSEDDGAALPQVNTVIARLRTLADFDPSLRATLEVLEPAAIQMQEAVYGLRHYQQKLEVDPQRLHEAEARLNAVNAACRKYRVEPDDIPGVLERARVRLAEVDAAGDRQALEKLEAEARAAYDASAKALSAERRMVARRFASEVTAAMQTLAMAGGVFDVDLDALSEPGAHGLEHVEFRVAAHKTAAPQALARVASGGELSRLSLAIQTVASQVAQVPTLIFDEVDSGIGGRVAEIVGKMLKQLGRTHQVMCITHLPQVAACADHQWQVVKTATTKGVVSKVTALDAEQRLNEIARMLGGLKITDTTRKHAAEMLGVSQTARRVGARTP